MSAPDLPVDPAAGAGQAAADIDAGIDCGIDGDVDSGVDSGVDAGPDEGTAFEPEPVLPEPVRQRVIALAAAALVGLPADELPVPLRRVAKFAPNRRARLGGPLIATQLAPRLPDEAAVRAVRLQLWAEHLERSVEDVAGDPAALVDEVWRPRAEDELDRRRRDGYVEHRLTLLPHVSRRAQAMWGPISGLLVDG